MFYFLSPYRHFLAYLFLICYLQSAFNTPLFEALHFFSHANDMVSNDQYEIHSWTSHNKNHTHQHKKLEFVADCNENENLPIKNQETPKKKIEITDSQFIEYRFAKDKTLPNYDTPALIPFLFYNRVTPPPQIV